MVYIYIYILYAFSGWDKYKGRGGHGEKWYSMFLAKDTADMADIMLTSMFLAKDTADIADIMLTSAPPCFRGNEAIHGLPPQCWSNVIVHCVPIVITLRMTAKV